jgi:hypothetical protein
MVENSNIPHNIKTRKSVDFFPLRRVSGILVDDF